MYGNKKIKAITKELITCEYKDFNELNNRINKLIKAKETLEDEGII